MGRIFHATTAPPSAYEYVLPLPARCSHGFGFSRTQTGAMIVDSCYMTHAHVPPSLCARDAPSSEGAVGQGTVSVQLGDVVTTINGEPVVGFNHATSLCTALSRPTCPLDEQVVLGFRRSAGAAGGSSWRQQVRQRLKQMGVEGADEGEGEEGAPGSGKDGSRHAESKQFSWAERAGRPGGNGYQVSGIDETQYIDDTLAAAFLCSSPSAAQ